MFKVEAKLSLSRINVVKKILIIKSFDDLHHNQRREKGRVENFRG